MNKELRTKTITNKNCQKNIHISTKKKTKMHRSHRTKIKNNYQKFKNSREIAKMHKKYMQKINIENINYFPRKISEERKLIKLDCYWIVYWIIPYIFSKTIYYGIPWIISNIICLIILLPILSLPSWIISWIIREFLEKLGFFDMLENLVISKILELKYLELFKIYR